jgi:hypothetical protein
MHKVDEILSGSLESLDFVLHHNLIIRKGIGQ